MRLFIFFAGSDPVIITVTCVNSAFENRAPFSDISSFFSFVKYIKMDDTCVSLFCRKLRVNSSGNRTSTISVSYMN
jgi:hypothetical protein